MFLWSGSFDRLLSLFAVLCPMYSVLDLLCLVLWPWSYRTSVPGSPLSSVCSLTLVHGLLVRLCFVVLLLWIPVLGLLSSYIFVWCWNEVHPFCSPSFVLCYLASVFLSFDLSSFILGKKKKKIVRPLLYFVYGIIQRSLEAVIYGENGRCHRSGDDNSLSDR